MNLEQLAARIPAERRVPAPPEIAGPAEALLATWGTSDGVAVLREALENLLVTAMDRDTAAHAHPAFVAMLAQLAPDELRMLGTIEHANYAALDVYENGPQGRVSRGPRTLLGIGTIAEERQPQYVLNLDRLGIVRLDWSTMASSRADYNALKQRVRTELATVDTSTMDGSIIVTWLGQQFIAACQLIHKR
jgi:hypothetical protein